MVGGALYYHNAGAYYRNTSSGYIVVRPPVGAVISVLPSGYQAAVVNGVVYYSYGGSYYQQVSNGYLVVADPTAGSYHQLAGVGKVVVTAQRLNVRSGPGQENAVVGKVFSGDILQVIGNAPGWYYVRFADGTSGWVMANFTSSLARHADG